MGAVRDLSERELLGSLLKGGSMLFGRRVELSWPDGAPYPEEELRSIGEQWAPRTGTGWVVRADTGFCDDMVPCGRELDNSGSCNRHGAQAAQAPGEAAPDDGWASMPSMTGPEFADFSRRHGIRWEET